MELAGIAEIAEADDPRANQRQTQKVGIYAPREELISSQSPKPIGHVCYLN